MISTWQSITGLTVSTCKKQPYFSSIREDAGEQGFGDVLPASCCPGLACLWPSPQICSIQAVARRPNMASSAPHEKPQSLSLGGRILGNLSYWAYWNAASRDSSCQKHLHYFSSRRSRKTTYTLAVHPRFHKVSRFPKRSAACWQQSRSLLSLSNLKTVESSCNPVTWPRINFTAFHFPPAGSVQSSSKCEASQCWNKRGIILSIVCVLLPPATLSSPPSPARFEDDTFCLPVSQRTKSVC